MGRVLWKREKKELTKTKKKKIEWSGKYKTTMNTSFQIFYLIYHFWLNLLVNI